MKNHPIKTSVTGHFISGFITSFFFSFFLFLFIISPFTPSSFFDFLTSCSLPDTPRILTSSHVFPAASALHTSLHFPSLHSFDTPRISYGDWFHVPEYETVANGVVPKENVLWYYAEDPDFTQAGYDAIAKSLATQGAESNTTPSANEGAALDQKGDTAALPPALPGRSQTANAAEEPQKPICVIPPDPTACPLHYGWLTDPADRHRYYFGQDGIMVDGMQEIDGQAYVFSDVVDPGNYRLDQTGRWRYTENGAPPYGALLSYPNASPEIDCGESAETPDPELVTKRYVVPRNGNNGGGDREHYEESGKTGNTEAAETNHGDGPHADGKPCIAVDDWETILAHPEEYEDCVREHCLRQVYLTSKDPSASEGPVTDAPLFRVPEAKNCYPIDVALENFYRDSDDASQITGMEFVMARENPDLRALPMHLDRMALPSDPLNPDSDSTYAVSNEEGYAVSFVDAFLNGPPEQGELSYAVVDESSAAEEESTASTANATLYTVETNGYDVRSSADTDSDDNLLPIDDPALCYMQVSRGCRIESETGIDEKTTVMVRPLWIPSEKQITGHYTHSLDLNSMDEDYDEKKLAHPRWEGGRYWLRTTPSAAETYAGKESSFLTASASGQIAARTATDMLSLRIGFTVAV